MAKAKLTDYEAWAQRAMGRYPEARRFNCVECGKDVISLANADSGVARSGRCGHCYLMAQLAIPE